jgi:hypothetical protein
VAAVVAWRLRHGPLARLHFVLLAAFALGAVAMSRIVGDVWFWLGLWGAVLSALMVVAVVWTAAVVLARRWDAPRRPAATWGLAGLAVVMLAAVGVDARHAEPSGEQLSATLSQVAPQAIAALGEVDPAGSDERYLVTYSDPINLGMHAFGLVNELERAGYRAGMVETHRPSVGDHRVFRPGEATAVIHLAVGPEIDRWRSQPGARELAYLDDRSPAEREEYVRVHRELVSGLKAAGRADLAGQVDTILLAVAMDPDVPPGTTAKAERLMEIGLPTAVFLGPA